MQASDAPSDVDPRADDGSAPTPPANVAHRGVERRTRIAITFNASPDKDVVGYRLYRSVNDGPFANVGQSGT